MTDENFLNHEEQNRLQELENQLKESSSYQERKQIITKIALLREKSKIKRNKK
ncbi:hypothetical protein [Alteribacillus bidgolensis]|uniref:hypothetical protein n=1 Tax=Alteribacillus bidgolensis TaxID=930129 RepID=UPI0014766821|nr:hypothetical protein [Alteribacillus bidgolensis]